jgi:hypothetical protein
MFKPKTSQPTTFDAETTKRMLAAVAREARPPAQRTGVGAVAQPGRSEQ